MMTDLLHFKRLSVIESPSAKNPSQISWSGDPLWRPWEYFVFHVTASIYIADRILLGWPAQSRMSSYSARTFYIHRPLAEFG